MNIKYTFLLISLLLSNLFCLKAQVNFTPWGNITGIIYQEEVVPFETSLRVLNDKNNRFSQTRHYGVDPSFKITDNGYLNQSKLEQVVYSQKIENLGNGKIKVNLTLLPEKNMSHKGVFFCVEIAEPDYLNGFFEIDGKTIKNLFIKESNTDGQLFTGKNKASKLMIKTVNRSIEIVLEKPMAVQIRKDISQTSTIAGAKYYHVFFTLLEQGNNNKVETSIALTAQCKPDSSPVLLTLDANEPGSKFAGIGGNFRLQFPKTDPQVIQWCLDSLNVKWSRIGMWWSDWHPEESVDPIEAARAGKLAPIVYKQIEMAKELNRRGLPVIVSAWFPPKWAALEGVARPGTYGEHLSPAKWEAIVSSITKYLLYLKKDHGIEAILFSFNEPEIGVRVVQSAMEHVAFIKMLGKSFAENGLTTKLILGDTSNGTPYALGFVNAGIEDQSAHQYIGALGFHTWGGMENENLIIWKKAAQKLQVPLLVTESGPDSEAHRNPDLFLDNYYQLQEIDLYLRLGAVCQPHTIMQWQLTADYSPLSGGGVYANEWPLRTTWRYWNLKQLGNTTRNTYWLPLSGNNKNITCAATGDIANSNFSIHLVNNGAKREITVEGIPSSVKSFDVLVTDAKRGMEKINRVNVVNGKVVFMADAQAFTTLTNVF